MSKLRASSARCHVMGEHVENRPKFQHLLPPALQRTGGFDCELQ